MDKDLIECPICFNRFPGKEIEHHASRCMFLRSNSNRSNRNKKEPVAPLSAKKKRNEHVDLSEVDKEEEKISSPTKRLKSNNLDNFTTKSNVKKTEPGTSKAKEKISTSTSSNQQKPINSNQPLAEKARPENMNEYFGQEHVLGENSMLSELLAQAKIPSMILWGPPGCGKTTLAHIIAQQCRSDSQKWRFIRLSATTSNIAEVKEAVQKASNELKLTKRKTILFMDEIHRFNKLQQDIFLPHVESGTITLIGATTENPSFSLNNALLSRCRVIILEKLEDKHIEQILRRAIPMLGDDLEVEDDAIKWLASVSDGDARIALNSLQMAYEATKPGDAIQLEHVKDGLKRSHLLYDRKGDGHYDTISALHKSIRASDENAALYWLARMLRGGEDPRYIARRLVRCASEDIGLGDPTALPVAIAAMQGCQLLGMPECDVLLSQATLHLARAPKSWEAYHGLTRAYKYLDSWKGAMPAIPLHLRNAPTRLMKDMGCADGYNRQHKDKSGLNYLPEGVELNLFEPGDFRDRNLI